MVFRFFYKNDILKGNEIKEPKPAECPTPR